MGTGGGGGGRAARPVVEEGQGEDLRLTQEEVDALSWYAKDDLIGEVMDMEAAEPALAEILMTADALSWWSKDDLIEYIVEFRGVK